MGALTGGMAWEALNNIAVAKDSKLVIVVNDNGRSYTPTIGGLANALTALRTNPRYEQILDLVKKRLTAVKGVGPAAYDALHAMKKGVKDALAPQGLFEDLGLKYVGPVDGHDERAVEVAAATGARLTIRKDNQSDFLQWLFPLLTSSDASRVQCAFAILVSSRTIPAALASLSGTPARLNMAAT